MRAVMRGTIVVVGGPFRSLVKGIQYGGTSVRSSVFLVDLDKGSCYLFNKPVVTYFINYLNTYFSKKFIDESDSRSSLYLGVILK